MFMFTYPLNKKAFFEFKFELAWKNDHTPTIFLQDNEVFYLSNIWPCCDLPPFWYKTTNQVAFILSYWVYPRFSVFPFLCEFVFPQVVHICIDNVAALRLSRSTRTSLSNNAVLRLYLFPNIEYISASLCSLDSLLSSEFSVSLSTHQYLLSHVQ